MKNRICMQSDNLRNVPCLHAELTKRYALEASVFPYGSGTLHQVIDLCNGFRGERGVGAGHSANALINGVLNASWYELSKAEAEELLPARKGFHEAIPLICIDALLERMAREDARDLAEDEGAGVHAKSGKCDLIVRFPIEMSEKKSRRFSSTSSHF